MLSETSKNFRSFFLLYFTNEIINNFKPNISQKIIHPIQTKRPLIFKRPIQKPRQIIKIPDTKLPPHLQYLKPTISNQEIDLGKINQIIKDPMVKEIECNGSNSTIIVRGIRGTKETNIVLNAQEIEEIIQTFSEKSKIPVHEGLFKVFFGKFIFSAIISKTIGSKFIITKANYNPNFNL